MWTPQTSRLCRILSFGGLGGVIPTLLTESCSGNQPQKHQHFKHFSILFCAK